MNTLKGEHIRLRPLEPEDLDFLYQLENEESFWEVSNTITPYSRFVLKQYLDNAHRDIYEVQQLRLVISHIDDSAPLGCIDLFDFDPHHGRAGVGIIIFSEKDRRKGFAAEALALISEYAFSHLKLHQLFANISEDNKESLLLFESQGFQKTGQKKAWIATKNGYKDEYLYQLINPGL